MFPPLDMVLWFSFHLGTAWLLSVCSFESCLMGCLRAKCCNQRGRGEKIIFCIWDVLCLSLNDWRQMSTLQNRQQKSLFDAQMSFLMYWRSFRGIWVFMRKNWGMQKLAAFRVETDIHHEKKGTLRLNWYNWEKTYEWPNEKKKKKKKGMWVLSSPVLEICFSSCFGLSFLSPSFFACIIFVFHSVSILVSPSQVSTAQCKYHTQPSYLVNKCTCWILEHDEATLSTSCVLDPVWLICHGS